MGRDHDGQRLLLLPLRAGSALDQRTNVETRPLPDLRVLGHTDSEAAVSSVAAGHQSKPEGRIVRQRKVICARRAVGVLDRLSDHSGSVLFSRCLVSAQPRISGSCQATIRQLPEAMTGQMHCCSAGRLSSAPGVVTTPNRGKEVDGEEDEDYRSVFLGEDSAQVVGDRIQVPHGDPCLSYLQQFLDDMRVCL